MTLVDKSEVEGVRCKDVPQESIRKGDYENTFSDMKHFIAELHCAGLAAPQVGIKRTFFMMWYGNKILTCINPSWEPKGDKQTLSDEGCLTYGRKKNKMLRYKMIKAKFQDESGKEIILRLRAFDAFVFQHECDHLIGETIFYDVQYQ